MRILWLDPFHGGSHAAVSRGYAAHSAHQVELLTMPIDGGWRWRMRGAAVSMARMAHAQQARPDLIIASDMLDLATFRGLTAERFGAVPTAIYFHENQLTYPLPPGRARDLSFAWTNYTSALAADAVIFNSAFHGREFLAALPGLLGRYHDYQELESIAAIAEKAHILPPGIDLASLGGPRTPAPGNPPTLLWNSRWEYDKQPAVFFAALEQLERRGISFRLIVAGEHIDPAAPDFVAARERWAAAIDHWGYAPSRTAYAELLRRADIVVSSAAQEFFGISVLEALACGCVPVLPRRLTYPELLPPAYGRDCLYDQDSELAEQLAATIGQLEQLRGRDWPALAAPYGWERIVPHYDALFERLVSL
jgi:glycosyltransferase involved in cell wall biosynthesis